MLVAALIMFSDQISLSGYVWAVVSQTFFLVVAEAGNRHPVHVSRCTCISLLTGQGVGACAEDPLVGSIAQQLLTDREAHDKTAAEWTRRYAQG